MLEQFSRWLRRYQGIESNPIYRLAADVASGRMSLDHATEAAQAPHVNGRLADGDLIELDRQVEFEAASSMEFALILARINLAAARAKGFEKVQVDLNLRVADLLEREDQIPEREYYFHEALVVAQRISYASGLKRTLNRLARHSFERDDTQTARNFLAQQLATGREDTDSRDEVESALLLADLFHSDGDSPMAYELYSRAMRSARRLGYARGEVDALLRQVTLATDRGDADEALALLMKAGEGAERTVDVQLQADVAFQTGMLYRDLRMPAEAIERFRYALGLARSSGDSTAETRCMDMLSLLEQRSTPSSDAVRKYQEVISLETRLGNRSEVARAYLELGQHHAREDRYSDAEEALQRARDVSWESGDLPIRVEAHGQLGKLLGATDRERAGTGELLKAVEGSRDLGDRRAEAHWLVAAAELVLRTGEPEDAAALAQRAEQLSGSLNDNGLKAEVFGIIGQVALVERRTDDALDAFTSAVAASRAAGNTSDTLRYLPLLSKLAADVGSLDDAIRYLDMAAEDALSIGDRPRACSYEGQAARLYGAAGMLADAEVRHRRAIAIAEQSGDQKLLSRSLQGLAAQYDTDGKLDEAMELYQRSLTAAVRAGDNRSLATAHYNLGALLVDEDRDDEARDHLLRARDEAEALHDYGLADRARALLQILAPPSSFQDSSDSYDMPLSERPVRPRAWGGSD